MQSVGGSATEHFPIESDEVLDNFQRVYSHAVKKEDGARYCGIFEIVMTGKAQLLSVIVSSELF